MLKELIDQFYLDQQKEKAQFHFYITDAGKCNRSVFFKFKNVPRKKMEPRILRIFDHGEQMHRNIFSVLYRLKIGVTTEVSIPTQEIVSGRADAILSINNENYILDIKSMNSSVFRNLTGPKQENLYQIQLYLHFFNIKKGILLYIDKDQQELKEFFVEYDSQLCQQLLDNFKNLQNKINNNILPAVLSDYPKNWQCDYCQFREICDIIGPREVNWQEFKDKIENQNFQQQIF